MTSIRGVSSRRRRRSRYAYGMKTKPRPPDCCSLPSSVVALPESDRDRLVAFFRALGDPTRLEIFRIIAGHPAPVCVCDIAERFDVSQPTISYHLKILREAGLVTATRRGVWAYYAADPRGLAFLESPLGELVFRDLAAAG